MSIFDFILKKYRLVTGGAQPWSGETYWSCFGYENFVPDDLHCTHKFFGELDAQAVEDITMLLDGYFKDTPFMPFTVNFTKEEFFGKDKDVRVLRPQDNTDIALFHPKLKATLDRYATDNFPSYKPHVTTDMEGVSMPFNRYCFCQGPKILREYTSGNKL